MPEQSVPLARYRGQAVTYSFLDFEVGPGDKRAVRLHVPHPKGTTIRSLKDFAAVASRPFSFVTTPELIRDPVAVGSLQRQLADDMIVGEEL